VAERFQKVPIPYTRIRELNVWTLSNFLSLLRVLLLPFIYLCLFHRTQAGDRWALILMLAGALTDFLDGEIARLRRTISSFGKIIDPLADKICMASVIAFLIFLRGFPIWLLGVIVARDVWILIGGALLIRRYKIVFPANIWGKLYSFSLALLIAAYTLSLNAHFLFWGQLLVILMTLVSTFSYTSQVFRYVRKHNQYRSRGRKRETAVAAQNDPDNVSPSGTAAKV
jgi:cardiolipin synthase (CMP-forming)